MWKNGNRKFLLFLLVIVVSCTVVFNMILTYQPQRIKISSLKSIRLESIPQDDPSLVQYVKESILVPPAPRTKPYNFTGFLHTTLPFSEDSRATNLENPSQVKQNLVVLDILKQINKNTNGFFIECGAVDGVYISNTLYLERRFNWTGLLVEVFPEFFNRMQIVNRKAWSANTCLSMKPHPQLINLHLDPKNWVHSLVNNSYYHVSKQTLQVECIPLYTFLLALGKDTIEYFSLDVDGAEYEILQTIPFDKVKFLVLEVEVFGAEIVWKDKEIFSLLENNGYVMYQRIYGDVIFIHESIKGNITFPKAGEKLQK